ncbi:TIGR00730 family Rossman fold protein [Diaphorobacter ruginosibacter]|uniref:LOG family protein n=1 Tax=Diaphorobacter ruginosibacter TaxID=1715720 RepID=UPI00333EC8DA
MSSPTPTTAQTHPAFSICVYLGSRPGENPAFAQAAQEVGQWIGERGGQLVYGGGRGGLMGTVAEATRLAGGRVVGVIPKALVDKELANHACDELHIVDNMHERKAMMAERSDAFVALPGGIGTFEELFEIWTWRQLGYHDKPLGLLNVDGYYDGLIHFLNTSVSSGLMGEWQMDLITFSSDKDALLRKLVQEAGNNMSQIPLREVI